jgi:multidrug efflux pump subunit AcrA (membrane-fusion protein)
MFGDLTLRIIDHPDALTLPNDVVRHDDGGTFVYVLDRARALRRTVETGLTSDDRVEIVSGIDDGARVVAGSSPELKGGASVRAVADTATPRSAGEREDSAR